MAYTRPAAPLEINPNSTLLPNAIVWALGNNGSGTSFGRAALDMSYVGDPAQFVKMTDYSKIFENSTHARFEIPNTNGLESHDFTAVVAFYVPETLAVNLHVWNTTTRDKGTGFIAPGLQLLVRPDLSVTVNRANEVEMINKPGQLVGGAVNTIALTRNNAANQTYISINGNTAIALAQGDFEWGAKSMFGNGQFRSEPDAGIELHFFAQAPASTTQANLAALSADPGQVVRTVGTSGAGGDYQPTDAFIGSTGSSVRINFPSALGMQQSGGSTTSGIPTSAFSVPGHTVTSVSSNPAVGAENQVVLGVDPLITGGEILAVSYTKPASGPSVRDAFGNEAASFTALPLKNLVMGQFVSAATNGDGTAIVLTANKELRATNAGTEAFTVPGRTVTGLEVAGKKVTLFVTPTINAGDTATVSHSRVSPGSVSDTYGVVIDSVTDLAVANVAGAGIWKFLGNEGQTVTVPANSRVRYGVEGKYVEKIVSGTITISNATFTDPATGAIKHADIYVTDMATGYAVTGPNMGPVGESSPFVVSVDGLLPTPLVITPSAPGLTFSPSTITLTNANLTALFSAVSTVQGAASITFTNNGGFANPAAMSYQSVTSILKTFGSAGDDFADLNAAIDYANTIDPAGSKLMVVLEGTANVASVNRNLKPASADADYYVLVRPKAAQSFAVLNQSGALHESMSGLTMNIAADSLRMGGGVVLEGWKINITAANGLQWRNDGAAPITTLRRCFVLANADNAMANNAYRSSRLEDCFVVRTSAHTGKFFTAPWVLQLVRTTFLSKGGTTPIVHDGGWSSTALIEDCAYSGFPSNPIGQLSGFTRRGNVISSVLTDATGFTIDTAGQFFADINSNYRAGPALRGKASQYSKSTLDILGNNRGLTPDVGAAQFTPATPLAVATVTNQPVPDGSSQTFSGTYSGTVNSATITLSPGNPADGAESIGPLDVPFSGGTWSITVDDHVPGNYVPSILFMNEGGAAAAAGAKSYTINGVSGGTVDPGVQEAATGIVWTIQSTGAAGVESPPFTVSLNGSYQGTVRVTPTATDGTFNPPYVDLIDGGSGTFTYTPATAGTKMVGLTNNAGLQNPLSVDFVATAQQLPGPSLQITTADGLVLRGPKMNLAGTVTLQDAPDAKLEMFLDDQVSSQSAKFTGVIAINGGLWSLSSDSVTPGVYRFRLVATANGQTVTARTGVLRVLGMTGVVALPVA